MNEQRLVVLQKPEPTKRDKSLEKLIMSMERATVVCASAGDAWAVWDVLQNIASLASAIVKGGTA